MFLIGETDGFKAGVGIGLIIVNERARSDFDLFFAIADRRFAFEVEADFDAVWVERAGPIQVARGMEFVPFEAESELREVAEHLPPTGADSAPGRFFGEEPRIDLRFAIATKLFQTNEGVRQRGQERRRLDC